MASVQYKMVNTLFKMLRVNKMLDKEGEEFEKLLETYRIKQKKPLAVPYKKMSEFDIITKTVDNTTVYVVRKKNDKPQKAVLYLFGGGYILPPDLGDIVLCGQIAKETAAEVWFPLYPMAPEHTLSETVKSTLQVYQEILKSYEAENVRFFGTSGFFRVRNENKFPVFQFYSAVCFRNRISIPVRTLFDDNNPVFLNFVDQIIIIISIQDIQVFINRVIDDQVSTHHAASPGVVGEQIRGAVAGDIIKSDIRPGRTGERHPCARREMLIYGLLHLCDCFLQVCIRSIRRGDTFFGQYIQSFVNPFTAVLILYINHIDPALAVEKHTGFGSVIQMPGMIYDAGSFHSALSYVFHDVFQAASFIKILKVLS